MTLLSPDDCAILRRQAEANLRDLDRVVSLDDESGGHIDARRMEVRVMLALLDTIEHLRSD